MTSPSSSPDIAARQLMRAGRFEDALQFAEQAVKGQHVCVPAHAVLATILLRLGRPLDAEMVVSGALQCDQGIADAYDGLAYVSIQLGRHERANTLYQRAVALAPQNPRLWYKLASSERSYGRLIEAQAACDRAISLDSTHYSSYLLRSELLVQTSDSNHVEELQQQLGRQDIDDRARTVLGYALGKELDDLQRFDEAFRWFSDAARARKRHLAYDVGMDELKMRRIAAAFPPAPTRTGPDVESSGQHIFIVGLPRSGTTLVERILTGLAGVQSNGETHNFARALLGATQTGSRDVFLRTSTAAPEAVAAIYTKLAGVGAKDEKIVEKLPMNYLYLGAIHRALPRAKLLLVRRSPLDTCFAMYRTLFGDAYPFSYDFDDVGRYYAAYDGLITHWRDSFGEHVHEIFYEDLVKDPRRAGAAVAKHCGLTWIPEAAEIHNNAAVSLTASAAQIRRPIYGSSSGRWRHYRAHLEPLIRVLRQRGVSLPADAQ
jgi:sulfotransferase family protein/tetratricopeptide repeat protein